MIKHIQSRSAVFSADRAGSKLLVGGDMIADNYTASAMNTNENVSGSITIREFADTESTEITEGTVFGGTVEDTHSDSMDRLLRHFGMD
ncbi:hypothetical protein RsTz2092_08950 [Deferribacterales bacterium RsTz2092]|nr:hypothetical protein AGMMS49941_06300 [Deferribacterales bacterium]